MAQASRQAPARHKDRACREQAGRSQTSGRAGPDESADAAAVRPPKIPGRRRLRVRQLALVVITFFAVGALAVAAVKHFARSPSSGPKLSAAQLRQEAANRNQAAAWVVQQVSRNGHRGLRQGDVCRAHCARVPLARPARARADLA